MSSFIARPNVCLKGTITLPGDKSIAHRSIILSAISSGKTIVKNFPFNQDCIVTMKALKKLGVSIEENLKTKSIKVVGRGLCGLKAPRSPVFIGNSGTTFRLLLGILAGQDFKTRLIAGKSLSRRPMLRVTAPLRMMGAQINSKFKIQNK